MSTFEKILLALSAVGVILIVAMLVAMSRLTGSNNSRAEPTAVQTPIEEVSPLVGHWVADDWAGGTSAWTDRVSGQMATVGPATEGPTNVAGAIEGVTATSGIVFDGSDDYFSVASDQDPIVGSRRATIVAFFTATGGASGIDDGAWTRNAGPLQGASPGSEYDWGLTYDAAGQAQGFFGSRIEPSSPVNLVDGKSHTMALTWESVSVGGDGIARLYVDGALVGSTEASEERIFVNNENGFVIGTDAESIFLCCEGSDTNRYFSGAIGELRFYNSIEDPASVHAEILGGSALTGQADDLGATTAAVTGIGYLNDVESVGYFRYGTDPSLSTNTDTSAQQVLGPSGAPVKVMDDLVGLSPDIRYYFRLEIENENGVFTGKSQSFLLGPEVRVEDVSGDVLVDQTAEATFLAAVGTSTAAQQFTITNTGGFDLTDLTVTIEGADADSFAVSALAVTTLTPATSTSFSVIFTPTSVGTEAAEVAIASNATDLGPVRFTVSGEGANVWSGPSIAFTNACAECATDLLTPNVSITRGESSGIYNPTTESKSAGKEGSSPLDTEWAYGTTAELGSLTFRPWFEWLGFKAPSRAVDQDAVLHLISDDIYIDIRFTSWVDGRGGGFSYLRSTPDP